MPGDPPKVAEADGSVPAADGPALVQNSLVNALASIKDEAIAKMALIATSPIGAAGKGLVPGQSRPRIKHS